MFDIGWTELLVIGVVALIVVGPKDLPGMFRALGQFTAKARGMAREFQRAMEEAADESGARDAMKDLRGMTNPKKLGLDKLNEAARDFGKWEPDNTKKKGPATQKLSEERAEKARQMHDASAKRAEERRAAEARPEERRAAEARPEERRAAEAQAEESRPVEPAAPEPRKAAGGE